MTNDFVIRRKAGDPMDEVDVKAIRTISGLHQARCGSRPPSSDRST